MLARLLIVARRSRWGLLSETARKITSWRERHRTAADLREARGMALLRGWLSPEQQAQLDALNFFDVTGCDTGRRYRIRQGTTMKVHEIDSEGRSVTGWCFAPVGFLAEGDIMLAQKIALETDEKAALAVANQFPIPTARRNDYEMHRQRSF